MFTYQFKVYARDIVTAYRSLTGFGCLRTVSCFSSYVHGYEVSASIKDDEFFDQLIYHQLLKDSASFIHHLHYCDSDHCWPETYPALGISKQNLQSVLYIT